MNKPTVKDSRVLTYLNLENIEEYHNTPEEEQLVQLWNLKFQIAESEQNNSRVNHKEVSKWRKAYMGIFNELDDFGNETDKKMKAIRKMVYELVEQKVNSRIPAPKMDPRYHSDILPVEATEALIRHEMNRMLSEEVQDESEHATLIDSTCWLKVSWDPFDNTHERSGMPVIECCPIDTVFPQPGIHNYKKLEYIFHRIKMTLAQINDMYGRGIKSDDVSDLVTVIECYFLNENRYVGKFAWVEDSLTVLCNDIEWLMRRRRECTECTAIVPFEDVCPTCGSKKFKYVTVKKQKLSQPLDFITNPYRTGETADPEQDQSQATDQVPVGTEIPYYLIRQLPFVPKRTAKMPQEIYGISEVQLALESQDLVNKFWNKAEKKSAKSKTYVTKLSDTRIDDEDSEIAYINVNDASEAAAIQVKQIIADISEELTMAQGLYENAKSTSGVTDTDQGKYDPSARSGKAKQLQMAASQSRQQSPLTQRNAAYAGVYELIFKYLLAFCDEERSFIKTMPDGSTREEVWSKYMFLDRDKHGNFYYRDDFAWSVDQATEITQDRASMWQLIDNDFMNGTMGSDVDPIRAMRMYWHLKGQFGYPTAKFALAFLNEAVQHLPTQVEQALVNNPEAVELALSYIADLQSGKLDPNGQPTGGTQGHGGARDGAGKPNNGQTHASQQQKANNQSRASQGQQTNTQAATTGGMQGGTE